MIIRVATFLTAPQDDREWVVDALKGVPGVRAAYHALDEESNAMLSISVFDDAQGEQAGFEAISARAMEIGHQGYPPDSIRKLRVVRYVENG